MTRPDLVLVAHGTRDPRGPEMLDRVVPRIREALPDVRVRLAYIELVTPVADDVMATLRRPTVVVPLLLSTGYHVKHDLPRSVSIAAAAGAPVTLTDPLGPSRLLARALADRLAEAGARRGDPVVLAAAGSSDPDASKAVRQTAALLGAIWRAPVRCAYASMGLTVQEAVQELRATTGRRPVSVAPYLLAPGRFASEVRHDAHESNARAADLLGTHQAVIELARHRYRRHAAFH